MAKINNVNGKTINSQLQWTRQSNQSEISCAPIKQRGNSDLKIHEQLTDAGKILGIKVLIT